MRYTGKIFLNTKTRKFEMRPDPISPDDLRSGVPGIVQSIVYTIRARRFKRRFEKDINSDDSADRMTLSLKYPQWVPFYMEHKN